MGGVGWGGTNEWPGTDHVTSGPMSGLQKEPAPNDTDTQTFRQTHRHGHSMTESAQWARISENAPNGADKQTHTKTDMATI